MGQRQSQLLDELITHELYIEADIHQVYDYVTQPERWREWHPSCLRAHTGCSGPLPQGLRFSSVIDLLGLQVHLNCRVISAVAPREFKMLFSSIVIDGSLHYLLQPRSNGTLFRRALHCTSDLNLGGLHSRLVQLSNLALGNLKHRLESPQG